MQEMKRIKVAKSAVGRTPIYPTEGTHQNTFLISEKVGAGILYPESEHEHRPIQRRIRGCVQVGPKFVHQFGNSTGKSTNDPTGDARQSTGPEYGCDFLEIRPI
jgi:hypothetical protein